MRMVLNTLCGAAALCFSVGCGDGGTDGQLATVPAKGTLKATGIDVKGLGLTFIADGGDPTAQMNGSAIVGEGGAFTVSTYGDEGLGAPVGKYKVVVSGTEDGMAMMGGDERFNNIPGNYKDPQQTPWSVDITDDPAKNDFILEIQ